MQKRKKYRIAVFGATGAVGRAMVQTLERRAFPVESLRLLASPRSAGQTIPFCGEDVVVEAVGEDSFHDIDIALFSAGAAASLEFAPKAVRQGAIVIDNSSAYRMQDGVPLVVPEVNAHALSGHSGIIANPNCSTIQLVVALNALKDLGIDHITVSTYQAVSGMGQKAIDALLQEMAGDPFAPRFTIFPLSSGDVHHPIAYNVLPQCDVFLDNGYTREEMKLVNESRKILEMPDLRVSPTAVRVPVIYGHSEAVAVRFHEPVSAGAVRDRLAVAKGVVVIDDPARQRYPHPLLAAGTGETYVGRIRQDLADPNAVMMFIVADNLLKGAAWNAVQIAEALIERAG